MKRDALFTTTKASTNFDKHGRAGGKFISMAAMLAKSIAVLGACLALVAVASASLLAARYGDGAYLASGLAAGLIWVLGGASLAMIALAPSPHARLNAALLGMLVRMGLPLVALMYFSTSGGSLAAAGIAVFIVIHYLAGLIVETLLAVRLLKHAEQQREPTPALT